MPERDEILDENRRLRAVIQQTRLRVVESRLSVTPTLSTAAETSTSIGDPTQAVAFIEEAERAAASARVSLGGSRDVPVALLESQLAQLEDRIRKLRQSLGPKAP